MIRPLRLFSIAIALVGVLLVGCDEEPDEAKPSPSAAAPGEASPNATTQPTASPSAVGHAGSNQRLAFVSNRDGPYRLYTMDADGGDIRILSEKPVSPLPFSVSQDGTQVAALGGDVSGNPSPCVYRVDVLGGATELLGQVPPDAAGPPVMPPHWQADDGAVLVGGDEACYAVPSGGGDVREESPYGCLEAVVLAQGPQGRLASLGPAGLEVLEGPSSEPRVLDGTMASIGEGEEGWGWDALFLRGLQRMGALRPVWSPHGERIAYLRYDANVHQSSIAVITAEGGEPRVLVPPGTTSGDFIFPAAWSLDGKRVIFTSFEEAAAIQDVTADHGTIRTLVGDDGYAYYFPQWVTEAPAPERPGTPGTATLWTTCGAGGESETDLPMFFLKSVDAARDAGLSVYWLGPSFEAGGALFSLSEAKFSEGIAGVPLQGLEASYSSRGEPKGIVDLHLFPRSDWDQVKDKVMNPSAPGVTRKSVSVAGREGEMVFLTLNDGRLNLVELVLGFGDVVALARANALTASAAQGGGELSVFINNPDLLIQVMENLRPYPQ